MSDIERIDKIDYPKTPPGMPDKDTFFTNNPAEFLVRQIALELRKVPEWKGLFGDNIDHYKRMDYPIRALPALRIYNDDYRKEFESWFVEGDIKADIIFPASLRRIETEQIPNTVSSALLQQFRRPMFFETLNNLVPGLNELGKVFTVDKSLGFEWEENVVPLTQLTINFRLDLRIWDDYLEQTDRTKDSPFEAVLANLKQIAVTINGLKDDEETTEVSVGLTTQIPTQE